MLLIAPSNGLQSKINCGIKKNDHSYLALSFAVPLPLHNYISTAYCPIVQTRVVAILIHQ